MNIELSPSHAGGAPWVLHTRRNQAMASALRRLYCSLPASTYAVYLPMDGGDEVDVAMTLASLSSGISPRMAVDGLSLWASRAHRTGEVVEVDDTNVSALIPTSPAAALPCSSPMAIVSVPVRTPRRRIGVLAGRWVLPQTLDEDMKQSLKVAADELAAELENLAEQGESIEAPYIPLFLHHCPGLDPPAAAPSMGGHQPNQSADFAAAASTLLFRLQKISTILADAERVQDVVAAAWDHVARPLGGRAMMLCLAEAGRLRIAGHVGFPREAVQRVEGTMLSRHTPETDTLAGGECLYFASSEELRQAYPDRDPDQQPEGRAYLPLIADGRVIGCCVLGFPESGWAPTSESGSILMLAMGQVGQALERARSYQRALTHTVQRSLLPRCLPQMPEAVVTARYLPPMEGNEVGGDWYDVVSLPGGGIGLVIGDVEGHTVDAAEVMGQLRSAVRGYANEGHDPVGVLEWTNRLLAGLDTDRYATCCYVQLDPVTGIARVATAGHLGPLISDAHGQLIPTPRVAGPPLGVDAHAVYEQVEICLEVGSVAALYTDGLLATRQLGIEAAAERLGHLLIDYCDENLERLADYLVRESRPETTYDDAALLMLRYEGTRPNCFPCVARTSVGSHDLHGVARVRHFLRNLLRSWGMAALCDDLELLASEMVTNALIHAHSDVDVQLRAYPDRVRVEVRDNDPRPPVPTGADAWDAASSQEAESGRGLLILETLAADWGISLAGRGTTVWCEIVLPHAVESLTVTGESAASTDAATGPGVAEGRGADGPSPGTQFSTAITSQ